MILPPAPRLRLLAAGVFLLAAGPALGGTVFFVVNTNDAGPGSLRQAILDANAAPGGDIASFAISGPLPYTIDLVSPLPQITDTLLIDGWSQPGFAAGARVAINGASAGLGADGLVITAPATVRGLAIYAFQPAFLGGGGNGIVLLGGNSSLILDNRIGTDRTGTFAIPNGGSGVLISDSAFNRVGTGNPGEIGNLISGNGNGVRIVGSASVNNLISGNRIGTNLAGTAAIPNVADGVVVLGGSANKILSAGAVQVVSGNGGNGITIAGSASGTFIAGNRIGTDAGGAADLGNGSDGVEISGSAGNHVGGGNLISGNTANGVLLINGATGNVVRANFIGTDDAGMAAIPNSANGVIVSGANGNTIGGAEATEGNLISGNGTNGVRVRSGAGGNVVQGNRIGTNHPRTATLPNGEHGVQLNDGAVNNLVGGPLDEHRNWIQGNAMNGVFVNDATTTGNTIQGNRILGNGLNGVLVQSATRLRLTRNLLSDNGALAVDLGGDAVTPNDALDADAGANALQNFPVLTRAGGTSAEGTLHSEPSTSYVVELFSSPQCDPSGHGEGASFLGAASVGTDASGNGSFSVGALGRVPLGHFVSATATDPQGNTSELSLCKPVSARFHTLTPCRVSDSRTILSPLFGGESRVLPVAGLCGVPATAGAVAANVTVVEPTVPGHLTLHSADVPVPLASTINYRAGQTRANNAIVPLGRDGDLRVTAGQAVGSVHVVLDVFGYFE